MWEDRLFWFGAGFLLCLAVVLLGRLAARLQDNPMLDMEVDNEDD